MTTLLRQPKARPLPLRVRAKVDCMFENVVDLFVVLSERWRDESAYEDIAEYGKVLAGHLPTGGTLMHMIKRPFGFRFVVDGYQFVMERRGNQVGWRRVSGGAK